MLHNAYTLHGTLKHTSTSDEVNDDNNNIENNSNVDFLEKMNIRLKNINRHLNENKHLNENNIDKSTTTINTNCAMQNELISDLCSMYENLVKEWNRIVPTYNKYIDTDPVIFSKIKQRLKLENIAFNLNTIKQMISLKSGGKSRTRKRKKT